MARTLNFHPKLTKKIIKISNIIRDKMTPSLLVALIVINLFTGAIFNSNYDMRTNTLAILIKKTPAINSSSSTTIITHCVDIPYNSINEEHISSSRTSIAGAQFNASQMYRAMVKRINGR